jgi:formylglycine-generating enzyme required for sulfatase activity/tRNA A-37 threonylcarbamoyl transferase component Bud32
VTTEIASGQILLGRYRLDRRLDEGGMSVVWAATHMLTGKQVALKLLKADAAKDEATHRRMLREARAACAVIHPNVVQIHDVLELPDGSPVLVMDLLTGEPLRERLNRRKSLSPAETATLMLPVISAVGTAHAAGVIHRDLKPDNIFLAQEGGRLVVKVLDFGIAKLVATGNNASQINALTGTGTMLGTPYYMAPEQILDEPIDHRVDIWALGVILYECLAGERPTEAENIGRILKRVLTNEIQPLSSKVPDLPKPLTALVERMLSQSAKDRPESLHEVGESLAPFAEGVTMTAFGPPSRAPELADSGEGRRSGPLPGKVPSGSRTTSELADTLMAPRPAEVTALATARAAGDAVPTLAAAGTAKRGRRAGFLLVAGLGALVAGGAAGGYFFFQRSKERPYLPASATIGTAAPGGPCPAGMGLVTGGAFRMGSDDGKDDERPVHEVRMGTFCLDLTEVKAAEYFECMQRGACPLSESTVRWMEITDAAKQRESAQCMLYQTDRSGQPMNCISWNDADAFCRAAEKRLPTEAEWEYAAAGGTEHRRYPWGSDPPGPELLNVCDKSCALADSPSSTGRPLFDADDGAPTLAVVGSYPRGAARFGMLDMAGNVWEWTSSPYCTYPEHDCTSQYRVFRGGGWGGKFAANLRASARMWSHPAHRYNDVGFRCAREPR